MVYTVTFNPSLDYIISLQGFQMGTTNRTKEEQMLPGGKGINVSTVLHNLGIDNTAFRGRGCSGSGRKHTGESSKFYLQRYFSRTSG